MWHTKKFGGSIEICEYLFNHSARIFGSLILWPLIEVARRIYGILAEARFFCSGMLIIDILVLFDVGLVTSKRKKNFKKSSFFLLLILEADY